jgi:hypothetical protein
MAETRILNNDIDVYQGINPTVFKKVDPVDVSVTPFQTNKRWTVVSGSATSSCLPLQGVYTSKTILPALDSELTFNDAKNIDDSLQSVTYWSIEHLFYKYKTQPANTFGPTNLNNTKKHLHQSASILSFPLYKVGEAIKPGSFSFTGSGLFLASDTYGNVYDTAFNTSSIVNNVAWYEGFNEYFDASRISYESQNVTYVPGVKTTTGAATAVGFAAKFSGNGYITTSIPGEYSRDTDYSISFFISASNPAVSNDLIITKASSSIQPQYPFKVELSGSNQILYTIASNTALSLSISSSTMVTASTHVVCQKTGSVMQLYVNGALQSSASALFLINQNNSPLTASGYIHNLAPIYIGGYDTTSQNLSGVLDEIRVFNKALTSTEVGYLANRTEGGTFLQTANVGNVFSKQGIVVISSADYRYGNVLNSAYTSSYRSTLTSYELSVLTRLDAGDFNLSLNPTLTRDNNVTYHDFVSGSAFAPYITTIGLYDDAGQLLAIGKLAQPIRKRSDVDMNFLVRIDIDKNILPG